MCRIKANATTALIKIMKSILIMLIQIIMINTAVVKVLTK